MLHKDLIDKFWQQGYLVIEDIIDNETISAIQEEYSSLLDKLFESWIKEGKLKSDSQSMDFWQKLSLCQQQNIEWYQHFDISLPHDNIRHDTPMHFGPAIFNLVTHKNILDTVESLIGSEITSNPIQHVRIKPPQIAVPDSETRAHIIATDWHQDKGVTLEEADNTDFVTVWLAVTDATVENGCLQVAEGKFDELLQHHLTPQATIPKDLIDQSQATPLPVKAGSAIIFHPLTPHCSLDNKSDVYRWSFDLRYNVTGQPTGRSHFPEFIARSRENPDSELRDWREWKKMWEDARANLSQQEHIPQHRWSSAAQ